MVERLRLSMNLGGSLGPIDMLQGKDCERGMGVKNRFGTELWNEVRSIT